MKAVVIGAGIAGLSVAYNLVEGGVDTVVLDGNGVGEAASAGNAGWVTPFLSSPRAAPGVVRDAVGAMLSPRGPARIVPHAERAFAEWTMGFLRASTRSRHTRGAQALRELGSRAMEDFDRLGANGVQFEQHRQGLGIVAKTHEALEKLNGLVQASRHAGYAGKITILRGQEVIDFDAAIARNVAGVIHLVDERHVRPESLTQGLADAVKSKGGKVVTNDEVVGLTRHGSFWHVSTHGGGLYTVDKLVIAAGFGSKAVLAKLGINLPLEAASGTSLTAVGQGIAPQHALKFYESMVACSAFEGGVRLSGTYDVGQRSTKVRQRRLNTVLSEGLSYLHDWAPSTVRREWVGLRPTSPDDLPIVGELPCLQGVYVATGHGTLGITLAPTTGRLLAEEILSGTNRPELDRFRPKRFSSLH